MTLSVAATLLGACAADAPADAEICDRAAAHVSECLGTGASTPTTCDAEAASRALGASCDAIVASGGKGDGWWCAFNPWLAGCGDGGGGADDPVDDPPDPQGLTLTGYVGFTWGLGTEPSGIGCAKVLLEGDGESYVALTNPVGSFAFDGLAAGDYQLSVVNRDDEVALDRHGEPAVRTVTVGDDDDHEAMVLSLHADGSNVALETGVSSEDAVSRCGNVRFDLTLLDACSGTIDPYASSRYEWVVRLEGDGRNRYTSADCQPTDGDHWAWDGCGGDADDVTRATFGSVNPGSYRATAYRVDLPERNNLDYESELDWRRHQAFDLGEVEVDGDVTFEATVEDPWAEDC